MSLFSASFLPVLPKRCGDDVNADIDDVMRDADGDAAHNRWRCGESRILLSEFAEGSSRNPPEGL